ncbi:hypothetical protein T484DRAFT_1888840 [Baffinella frigidus]|nr:hypothetical protein T484DRAFT_1888840 [Cryptophyta sp. CCMP2293]
MSPSTPTQALRNNTHQPLRRLSVVCGPSGDFKSSTCDSPTSTPSPPTFAGSPILSSVKNPAKLPSLRQRRRATTDVTDANFKAHRHRDGQCLAHPSVRGCACEKVQQATLGQTEAWQVMALRFKVVHCSRFGETRPTLLAPVATDASTKAKLERTQSDPLTQRTSVFASSSPGANAPLKRQGSDPLLRRVEDLRERERHGAKSIEKVLSHLPARSTGSTVLAVPSRVAQRRASCRTGVSTPAAVDVQGYLAHKKRTPP